MKFSFRISDRWRHYVLELLVVFIGVTSAFLLNSWREHRQVRSLETNYLESIHSDLLHDREQLVELVALGMEQNRLLGRFLFDQVGGWSQDSTSTLVGGSLTLLFFSGKSTTYEALKYSGHLSHIRDFELRNEIVNYYESFGRTKFVEEIYYYWVTQYLTPFYIDNFDMMGFRFVNRSIPDEASFKNRMFGLQVLVGQNLITYGDLLEANERLFARLNRK